MTVLKITTLSRGLGAILLVLALGACSTTGDESQELGLHQDTSVDLVWPAAPEATRVRYYNSLVTNAPWLADEDYISFPRGVAFDESRNRLYVTQQHGVRIVDTETGELSLLVGIGEHGIEQGAVSGIAVSADGRVFVSDQLSQAVKAFSPNGDFLGEIAFESPKGLAIDRARERLYVTDGEANTLTAWTLEGDFLYELVAPEETPLALPLQPAVNSNGDVYVVNWGRLAVHVFDAEGNHLRAFGERGTTPGAFVRPKGIAIDGDDNVYVADAAFGNIQIFTPDDELAMWFGDHGSDEGRFALPNFMAFDSQNRLFVPEYGTHRVQIFQYLSLGR